MTVENKSMSSFENLGKETDMIDVKISHRIVELFSEGLYSSPHKAIEELVSNSFDAGAHHVDIIFPSDLREENVSIAIIDDGEGMNVEGLKGHWIIGKSTRRESMPSSGRKPIGKFGIGKLSTYVLAYKFTHICKSGGKYYAATMDYSKLQDGGDRVFGEESIEIPLRTLTEGEVKEAIKPIVEIDQEYSFELFGSSSPKSWTIAIMSNLKSMGKEIKRGRLDWILRTAMPQRDDFALFLDGKEMISPKLKKPLKRIILGKDVTELPSPCIKSLQPSEDAKESKKSMHRHGLSDGGGLGRITGFIEIFEKEIDSGKDKFGHSNGFFVYVHKRLVNADDSGFGIDRNILRHGTFSRCRIVVHIDALDSVLRSSRESFLQSDLYGEVKNLLRGGFNEARNYLDRYDKSQTTSSQIAQKISSVPRSLGRRPLLALIEKVIDREAQPFYMHLSSDAQGENKDKLLNAINHNVSQDFNLEIETASLDPTAGMGALEIRKDRLCFVTNSSHPFFLAFEDSFANISDLPIKILLISEVILEANLYYMGLRSEDIVDAIKARDELIRYLVKSSSQRTPGMVAMALNENKDKAYDLEEEMCASFEVLGFDNVQHLGKASNPDGIADAYLSAKKEGESQRYRVGLEAKSGEIVRDKDLNVRALLRHMRKYECDHHLVIGKKFATSKKDPAMIEAIKSSLENDKDNRTITLMHIDDLAKLVRVFPTKRIGGLTYLKGLFETCIHPDESKAWVDRMMTSQPDKDWPYKEILEAIWERAKARKDNPVSYDAILMILEKKNIMMSGSDIKECCKIMERMAKGVVFARDNTVEIEKRPDQIMADIRAAISDYPREERSKITI